MSTNSQHLQILKKKTSNSILKETLDYGIHYLKVGHSSYKASNRTNRNVIVNQSYLNNL